MKFIFYPAQLPEDVELLKTINKAASALYKKLKALNRDSIDISDYNQKYVDNHVRVLERTLQKYAYVLAWSLASSIPQDCTFIDYGGGSGILSLLAKECGVGTVIYSDIYPVSCRDAKIIGRSLQSEADYYVQGALGDVISFLRDHSLSCDTIASYDVIEHIYDIEGFFTQISEVPGVVTVVMSSGANKHHPLIRRHIMKKQREVEYTDREDVWGHKKRDCTRAYLTVRKEIISSHEGLTEKEVEQLARVTRGMIESDIHHCVTTYVETGELPEGLDHPTNTCDPYTGNWAEHLMDPYHLKDILSEGGFKAEVLPGYYGHYNNRVKKITGNLLNVGIYMLGKYSMSAAPFFTIYGKRQ
jgi:2-polyprenyl-3-methyl-5-hydroxy-6-metoxy-1,4-benzoquinol methylase